MIGQEIAAWTRENLIIPPGHPHSGQPLELGAFLRDFFDDLFTEGIVEGGLSVARKNGKSSGCAALILYHLVGPGYRAGWRGAVLSTNGQTAGVMRDLIMALVESSGLADRVASRYQPQPGRVIALNGDAECQFYNASKSTALGANLDLAIADEFGEFDESSRRNVEMLLSSMPIRGGRIVGIGVRAHSHLFSELKDRAGKDTTIWHEYMARSDLPIDDPANIRAANPGVDAGVIPLENLARLARRAKGAPATEYEFRKYHLNLPAQATKDMLLSLADYERHVIVSELPPRAGLCSLGVDIGYSSSMTAACAFWPESSGRLEVFAALPSEPDLHERGQADGVGSLYVAAHDRGELQLHPGRVTDVGFFMTMLADRLAGEAVDLIADDYRAGEVTDALESLGLGWQVDFRRVGRGRDGQRDIVDSQKLLMSGKVSTTENLILASAIRFATLRFSSSTNFSELVKYKSNSRIDAAQALLLALGHGARLLSEPEPPKVRFFVA